MSERDINPNLKKCPVCQADAEECQGSEHSEFKGKFKIACAASNTDHDDDYPLGCPLNPETAWCDTPEKAAEVWNDRDVYAIGEVERLRARVKELEEKHGNKIFRSMEEFAKEYFPNSILEYRLVNKDDEPTKGDTHEH